MNLKDIPIALKNLFSNFRFFCRYNVDNIIQSSSIQNNLNRHDLNICKKNLIELYYASHPKEQISVSEEIDFIKKHKELTAFPYPQIRKMQHDVVADIDQKAKLPFIIHNGKRLYFTKNFTIESAKATYINYIERENLLGGGYTAKAPHQYQTDDFKVEQNDILLDIGCAEGLVALDAIETAKKIYLFECDEQWHAPLQATFAPYKDKVTLIPKFVSNTNSDNCITLGSLFNEINGESFFIKMDIEGEEENVLLSSKKFLESQNKIKIACCTYHREHHAELISKYLKSLNYEIEFSDGYVLFFYDSNIAPPYFRKGLIRAHK